MHIEFLPQYAAKNAVFTILGQQDLFHRAIDNVVRKALKFNPNQSKVSILTSVENGMIKITVSDKGTGVPEDELSQIYEPFYRGSQSLKTDGYGVGLSITKQIIEAHGGRNLVKNFATGGLSDNIYLPFVQALAAVFLCLPASSCTL